MKKLYFGLLLILMLIAFTACAGSTTEETGNGATAATPVVEVEQPATSNEAPAATPVAQVTEATPASAEEVPAAPQEPAPAPQDEGGPMVESVEVLILESLPVQIHVLVKGQLPDACARIEGHQLEQEGNTIHISLNTTWPDNQRCMAAPTPFEQTIPLAAEELIPGEYIVEVNGVSETFTLSTEMMGQMPAEEVEEQAGGIDRVKIFMVALEDKGQSGPEIGCGDSLVAVDRDVAPTKAPLTAAMNELLSVNDQYYGQSGFYNSLYQSDLQIENITIDEQGLASIYLTGTYTLGGVCDGPRFEAQLVETARQFSTVKDVSIFINGKPLKEILSLA
jgi:hypothetical protein